MNNRLTLKCSLVSIVTAPTADALHNPILIINTKHVVYQSKLVDVTVFAFFFFFAEGFLFAYFTLATVVGVSEY